MNLGEKEVRMLLCPSELERACSAIGSADTPRAPRGRDLDRVKLLGEGRPRLLLKWCESKEEVREGSGLDGLEGEEWGNCMMSPSGTSSMSPPALCARGRALGGNK